MGSDGNWTRMEIYVGGAHIATYADGTTYFRHTNWLGSLRALTTPDNPIPATTCSAYPFGDGQTCTSGSSTRNLFTDYVHDGETSLEHSWFRQYSSRVGRFHSPDPVLGNPADPQSWNRYAYALNDPMNMFDPKGRNADWCPAEDFSCGGGGGGGGSGWGWGDEGGGDSIPSEIAQGLNQYLFMVNLSIEELWLRNNFIVQRGPGGVYYSRDLAGAAAATLAYDLGQDSGGHEFNINVYQNSDRTYSYTGWERSPMNCIGGCTWFSHTYSPVGTQLVGDAHNHPPGGFGTNDTSFSQASDLAGLYDRGLFGYLYKTRRPRA